ncbi:hypothetical protein [Glutamicibacter uratoxydans]|nr:hypothetical protein [Glutamicibacter uratoxydans]
MTEPTLCERPACADVAQTYDFLPASARRGLHCTCLVLLGLLAAGVLLLG